MTEISAARDDGTLVEFRSADDENGAALDPRVSARMVHELANQLSIISSYLDLLADADDSAELSMILDDMKIAASKAIGITHDLQQHVSSFS